MESDYQVKIDTIYLTLIYQFLLLFKNKKYIYIT